MLGHTPVNIAALLTARALHEWTEVAAAQESWLHVQSKVAWHRRRSLGYIEYLMDSSIQSLDSRVRVRGARWTEEPMESRQSFGTFGSSPHTTSYRNAVFPGPAY